MSANYARWLTREKEFSAFATGPLLDFWRQGGEVFAFYCQGMQLAELPDLYGQGGEVPATLYVQSL